jgi:Cytochrome oxidase complex assembly protein 1
MSNCRGRGTEIDPTEQEVNQGVNEILEASLQDAVKHGEICPLCGHSKAQSISHRKSVQFGLLLMAVLIASGIAIAYRVCRNTERQAAVQAAWKQVEANPQVREVLGEHTAIDGNVVGDEAG